MTLSRKFAAMIVRSSQLRYATSGAHLHRSDWKLPVFKDILSIYTDRYKRTKKETRCLFKIPFFKHPGSMSKSSRVEPEADSFANIQLHVEKVAAACEDFFSSYRQALASRTAMEATDLPNLASAQLGAKILFATDEWFAAAGESKLSTSLATLDTCEK
jgi:hypothetical protein